MLSFLKRLQVKNGMEIVQYMTSIQVRFLSIIVTSETNFYRVSIEISILRCLKCLNCINAGSLSILPRNGKLKVTLATLKSEIYTVSPIQVSNLKASYVSCTVSIVLMISDLLMLFYGAGFWPWGAFCSIWFA